MSSRYKVYHQHYPHFITSTVVQWIDALSRPIYKDILIDSFAYCIQNKGLNLHAWVIMSNHFHIIASAAEGFMLPYIMRDLKKYTSKKLIHAIEVNSQESRKQWMMNAFQYAGSINNDNGQYQFWQHNYHPVELSNGNMFQQRLHYLHDNPVRAGLVFQSEHYLYSSAADYLTGSKGKLPLILF